MTSSLETPEDYDECFENLASCNVYSFRKIVQHRIGKTNECPLVLNVIDSLEEFVLFNMAFLGVGLLFLVCALRGQTKLMLLHSCLPGFEGFQ